MKEKINRFCKKCAEPKLPVQIFYVGIIVLFLLSILPLFQISQYVHPSADDYTYALEVHREWEAHHSIFGMLAQAVRTSYQYMQNWQGLYTSAFLLALQPGVVGEKAYMLTPLILIGSLIFAVFYFFYAIVRKCVKGSWLETFAMTSLVSYFMIQYVPYASESFYWYNGGMNYLFFFAMLLIIAGLLVSLCCETKTWKKRVSTFFLCFLSFSLAGGNHVTIFIGLLLMLFLLVVLFYFGKKRIRKEAAASFAFMLIGFLLNITSPGTRKRQMRFTDRPSAVDAIFRSLETGFTNITGWVLSVQFALFMICAIPLVILLAKQIHRKTGFRFIHPVVAVLFSFGITSAMFCPPIYAMNTPGAGRLYNIVFCMMVILLFVNEWNLAGWMIVHYGNTSASAVTEGKPKLSVVNILFLALLVIVYGKSAYSGTNAATAAALMQSKEAQEYSNELYIRLDTLVNADKEDVVLEPLRVKPGLIFFDDIEEDAKNWKNKAVAEYYGQKSVRLKTSQDDTTEEE